MSKPHIVFITTDQMRDDVMGCAGNEIIQTPAMDYLARRGVQFTKAISCQPVCVPARASIMTGLEGDRLGITEYQEGFELPTNETLPQLLRDGGYQTKAVGKMHVYPERCHYGFESMLICEEGRKIGQANDEFRGYDDYEMWLAEQGYAGQAFAHGMPNNGHSMTAWHLPDHLHPTEWIGTESCKVIKTRDWTRPLFLWASFTAPHPPFTPLMKDLLLYEEDEMRDPFLGDWIDRHPHFHQISLGMSHGEKKTKKEIALAHKAYYALISQVDRQINRIIGTLREEGMLENTWFIFTSDHGDNMGDHHLWGKRNFLRGSCQVPFIIAPPPRGNLDEVIGENWLPGVQSKSVVGLQDIMPTCLEIAGLDVPSHIDGKSLLPIVHQPDTEVRETILGEMGNRGVRTLMLTDGQWKYIWYEQDGQELLFNIDNDPYETEDLSQTNVSELSKWRAKLIDRLMERKDDRAVNANELQPSAEGVLFSNVVKARLTTDHNVRGIHI
ncbi:sulfatase-like hydrolase/transferase [Bacillus sp. FJAT-50079]|uniref:sulfatase-like hydrolase/transferase n=1 Tax=Bacillus sp. FJAT-50079 TaxID=2833577 RepID=UPI001BC9B1C6|nr:sulfatase-like hydrolase/transferase [Bacillus sp. FJAT-50079]MBS4210172.1 sulfatase-like hydrolase/transferase [Bacillus sp. FJAT-50079]